MARRMADDAQETFRARVTYRTRKRNPAYRWEATPDEPRFLDGFDEPRTACYGPYATVGAARAQASREAGKVARFYEAEVLHCGVDRADIEWTEV